MADTDVALRTAAQLVAAYREGELSPVEAMQATLDRIEQLNDTVNAYCLVDGDAALASARESEARWGRGEPSGPLDGVPTSIKDMFLTAGWPTLRGSQTVREDQTWDEDAPCVARLRETGAVLVGKTTTPEMGWKGVTDSPRTGITRNPWDPSKTPGGSSGGSAASVALGMGPLAIGTDAGGSVRIPGAFSGVFALKPTYGRIPLYPPSAFGTLSHAGPMTWTIEDAALLLDVVCGPDGRDWSALPEPVGSFTTGLGSGVLGRRVAFSPTLGYVDVDPEIAAVVASAVDALAGLGAQVEEHDPGFTDPIEAFNVLWYSAAAKIVEPFSDEDRARLDPGLAEVAGQGARYSALDYLGANAERMGLGSLMGRFHETYDLLVTPTVPIPAFDAGQEVPTGWPHARWTSWTPFTYPFNLTQQPAATVPCGFTSDGLPVGLQIVGARHADGLVLAAAKALEDARPWSDQRPELS